MQIEAVVKLWELSTLDPDELGNVMRGLVQGVQRFGDNLGYELNSASSEIGSPGSKPQPKNSSPKVISKTK